MGNSASSSPSIPAETSKSFSEQEEEVSQEPSGVYVSERLQQKILHEFDSKVLKDEWEEHQKYLIAKLDSRRSHDYETKMQLKQQLQSLREQDLLRQRVLDERIDAAQAQFSDLSVALQYDTDRIDQKLASISFKQNTEAPCLGPRTHVANCLQSQKGVKQCENYIRELQTCVEQIVVLKKI